jgi:hypothetical protein
MGYTEFENRVLNRCHKKTFKITNSWGAYDAYKHIRKNGWYNIERPLKEGEFYDIIRGVNNLLAQEILNGRTIKFPFKMGSLELRKIETGAYIVDDKLKIKYPIDWKKTIKLWYEDPDERKKKTLVRTEDKFMYYIKYNKFNANYENKSFYEFTVNRFIKKALKDKIKKQLIDAIW